MINEKFVQACKRNDVKKAKELLEASGALKINVNNTNCFGRTPIYHAIETKSLQSVAFLIAVGADLQKTSVVSVKKPFCAKTDFIKYHEPPLVTATRTGDLQSLNLLVLNGCKGNEFATLIKDVHTPKDINALNEEEDEIGVNNRCYAVHHAVLQNNSRILETLLLHGGQAEVRDHQDRTPMHYACVCKKINQRYCWEQREIMRLLILHGGNPHVTDRLSVTPLALAINYNCLPSVECILSSGPIPTYQLSMLGLATLKNQHDIVVRLIRRGFKMNLLNSRFHTPIQTDIFHQPVGSIASTLIFHGCDVNCFQRPIHMASLLYQVMRGFRLDCESIGFFLVKTGYNLNQDTWLLETLENEKQKDELNTENLSDKNSQVIQPTHFFGQDTLIRYGSFKKFPISSGRMTVLKNYFLKNLRNPLSLSELCRVSVRRCMSCVNGGVSVVAGIKSMALPPPIISFLLLGDIAIEQSNGSIQVFYPL